MHTLFTHLALYHCHLRNWINTVVLACILDRTRHGWYKVGSRSPCLDVLPSRCPCPTATVLVAHVVRLHSPLHTMGCDGISNSVKVWDWAYLSEDHDILLSPYLFVATLISLMKASLAPTARLDLFLAYETKTPRERSNPPPFAKISMQQLPQMLHPLRY